MTIEHGSGNEQLVYGSEIGIRIEKGTGVVRFNLHTAIRVATASTTHSAVLGTIAAAFWTQYPASRFVTIVDLHGCDLAHTADQNGATLLDWLEAERIDSFQHKNGASVIITSADYFTRMIRAAEFYRDGDVYFRMLDMENEKDDLSAIGARAARAFPQRSERDYAALLQVYHTVGLFECESLFLGLLSQKTLFTQFESLVVEQFGALRDER